MKKALILMSVVLLANPLMANATTKKHSKKHCKHVAVAKDADASKPAAAPSYLDNVSGTFDLTSNYIFRGISQSSNYPAAQGGLTYTFPIGLYANVWGSNVDFAAPNGRTATVEMDTIIGWHGTAYTDFTYDINVDRYNYPGARSANYNELNTLWGYKIFTLGISYSSNYSGTHASGTYVNGMLNFDIPPCYLFKVEGVSLQAETGHYSLARAAGNSYNDYMLGVTKKLSDKYAIMAQWTDTNGRAHLPPYDGSQFVGTITATF